MPSESIHVYSLTSMKQAAVDIDTRAVVLCHHKRSHTWFQDHSLLVQAL